VLNSTSVLVYIFLFQFKGVQVICREQWNTE